MNHLQKYTFKGYERPDGTTGIRNFIGVISTVVCANEVAKRIARNSRGIKAFAHGQGCAQTSVDLTRVERTLGSLGQNPNIAGVVLVSLGCESVNVQRIADYIADSGKPAHTVTIQEVGGLKSAIEIGRRYAIEMYKEFSTMKRTETDVSNLVFGIKCGGSDTTSGIVANPALGLAVDKLLECGATCIFGESTEFIGAEHQLIGRAHSEEVGNRMLEMILDVERRVKAIGVDMRGGQPTQGNIKGGLSTIEEKSLGAAIKTGSRKIDAVLSYGERISHKGLIFVDSPGREAELLTALVAAGATLIAFTTGRGAPQGFPFVPTIKITGNPSTAQHLREFIDVDVSEIISGDLKLENAAARIINEVIFVSSGKLTQAEKNRYEDAMNIYTTGPIL